MEVAAGKDRDFVIFVKEKQRVISNGVKLCYNDLLRVVNSAVHRAVYLRYAAEGVGILNILGVVRRVSSLPASSSSRLAAVSACIACGRLAWIWGE